MSEPLVIICRHLQEDSSLPCMQFINDPVHPRDSGETYICLECAEVDPIWEIEGMVTVCKCCCPALTIIETHNCKEGVN